MVRRRAQEDPARATLRAQRRSELLEAGVRVIRRDGPSPSMEAIAREAGVTKPILYRHFGDRSGLVAAVASRFADELADVLDRSLVAGGDARSQLVGAVDAYLAFVERDPSLYRFVLEGVGSGSAANLDGFLRSLGHRVALVLGEQLRAAGQDSGGAEPLAHGIVGFVHAAGGWWVEGPTMPRARLVQYLTDLLWDGLGVLATPERATVSLAEARRAR
ncbi:MAG: TetR/AcrR family transcriptional regulator [Acidimicrobiia bacterium]|nr:TetR/AcrR family transcriptional regulator [Acidimicrobiia bacterium]